jgi:hypothetical protein
LETRKIKRIVPALLKWYAANARDLPWRRTQDPYAVFISEIMLQQTQVKTVIPYYERWMRALPTMADFARARPDWLSDWPAEAKAQLAEQLNLPKLGDMSPVLAQERLVQCVDEIAPHGRFPIQAVSFIQHRFTPFERAVISQGCTDQTVGKLDFGIPANLVI